MLAQFIPQCSRLQSDAYDAPLGNVRKWLESFESDARHRLTRSAWSIQSPQNQRTKRQREFDAGRASASHQLASLGHYDAVGVNQDRSPNWPDGFVGSISHSDHWTWTAIGRDSDLQSIGIDTEILVDETTAHELRDEIATDQEWAAVEGVGLNFRQAFTVVFSAKEAFYKCWYPMTKRFLEFRHAVVDLANPDRLRICLATRHCDFDAAPFSLDVAFLIHGDDVFSLTSWENAD